jgi:hypothetical protein
MKNIQTISVRCESRINQNWDFTYDDGSVDSYEACEESARYSDGPNCDDFVRNHDPQLDFLLQRLTDVAESYLTDEWGIVEVEFDGAFRVTKVTHFDCDGNEL